MTTRSRIFWLARSGNSPEEYEDAYAVNGRDGLYALADGASEGCFNGLWAKLLVDDFVRVPDSVTRWPSRLTNLQREWDALVGARKLPWHADPWIEKGAHATFLGIILATTIDTFSTWHAVAVGDTCLLHTRGGTLLRSFPIIEAARFNNTPLLVGSRMAENDVAARCSVWSDGEGIAGDRLWAMTDALAHWCLTSYENGGNPWEVLDSISLSRSSDHFALWVEDLHASGQLKNDDVTLLALDL